MSSMLDLAAALGPGGGGPPGAAPAGLPPGLGPGGPPPPDQGGPPPDQGGDQDQGQYATSLDALDDAEQALHAFIQLDPDEVDRAQAGQALQIVLKLKAGNQKGAQQGDMKSLARALQGGGGPPGGPVG